MGVHSALPNIVACGISFWSGAPRFEAGRAECEQDLLHI